MSILPIFSHSQWLSPCPFVSCGSPSKCSEDSEGMQLVQKFCPQTTNLHELQEHDKCWKMYHTPYNSTIYIYYTDYMRTKEQTLA